MEVNQYSIHWINLDLTRGSEVNKARPCVVISPNEINHNIRTVIITPLTHTIKLYPSRVICYVKGDKGAIMLDQIRTVDKSRIIGSIGQLNPKEIANIKAVINQMLC